RVGDLRFEMAALVGVVFLGIRDVVFGLVFDDAFAHFPGEVETRPLRVALLEFVDDAQRLLVVVEAAVAGHERVERRLTRMAKRRGAGGGRRADGLQQGLLWAT